MGNPHPQAPNPHFYHLFNSLHTPHPLQWISWAIHLHTLYLPSQGPETFPMT